MNPYLHINRLEFVLTDHCTGRCKHCSVGERVAHPRREHHVPRQAAEQAIRFLADEYDMASVMTFGGAKGTITLSLMFTIPYTLADGEWFPMRDELIFIAGGVIIDRLGISLYNIGTAALVLLLSGAFLLTEKKKA